MQNSDKKDECQNKLAQTEDIFASKGCEVVKSGMLLILERLKFAKKHDAKIRRAICDIDNESELKATQIKTLIDTLKCGGVMDTSEVLSLVTQVIERLKGTDKPVKEDACEEVFVTIDERVKKWAQ